MKEPKYKAEMRKLERDRRKSVQVSVGFAQGFICAVCSLIRENGLVTTEVRDLWRGGGYKFEDLERLNIDEYDVETLNEHKSELVTYQPSQHGTDKE